MAVADRFPQCQLELGALFDRNLEVVVVELHPPAPTTLGEVHRGIGLLDRDHRRRARFGDRQPDARRHREQVVAEAERLLDLADQPVAERRDRCHVLEAAHHDQELVATETGHEVARSHAPSDPIGDLAQHEVAGRVTVRVVDALEAVDVDEHHGALVGTVHQHALEVLEHREPVGEAGERIMTSLVSELFLELLALRDVAGEHGQQRLRLGRHQHRLRQHRDRGSLRRTHQLLTVEGGQELTEVPTALLRGLEPDHARRGGVRRPDPPVDADRPDADRRMFEDRRRSRLRCRQQPGHRRQAEDRGLDRTTGLARHRRPEGLGVESTRRQRRRLTIDQRQ